MRIFFSSLILLVLAVVAGCNGAGVLVPTAGSDNGNYLIRDVELIGPGGAGVLNGGPGVYMVRWRFVYQGGSSTVGQPVTDVRPSVALLDDDDIFGGGDDVIDARQHTSNVILQGPFPSSNHDQTTFTITCVNGDVTGSVDGSGEGTAEIFARVERANGTGGMDSIQKIDVECP